MTSKLPMLVSVARWVSLAAMLFASSAIACGSRGVDNADNDEQFSDDEEQSSTQTEAQSCLENASCPDGQYCYYPPGNCGTSSTGVCTPITEQCRDYGGEWTCGCNGATYGNPCQPGNSGVNVLHDGPCDNFTPPDY